jgi:hypothetical protein
MKVRFPFLSVQQSQALNVIGLQEILEQKKNTPLLAQGFEPCSSKT